MTRRKDGISCTAKARSTGERCGNPPIPGGTVCRIHGGNVPVVRAAGARRVLEALVGPALAELRRLVMDPTVPDGVKISAIRDILDRTGHKPSTKIEFSSDAIIEAEIAELEAEQAP